MTSRKNDELDSDEILKYGLSEFLEYHKQEANLEVSKPEENKFMNILGSIDHESHI